MIERLSGERPPYLRRVLATLTGALMLSGCAESYAQTPEPQVKLFEKAVAGYVISCYGPAQTITVQLGDTVKSLMEQTSVGLPDVTGEGRSVPVSKVAYAEAVSQFNSLEASDPLVVDSSITLPSYCAPN